MFNQDFYPTPEAVILQMLEGHELNGKTVLEPSAGKGNIVDFLLSSGAEVIACENNADLKKILVTKCKVLADDFLTVTSDQISHIDMIVMNPPFSADEKHINHAWNIAPAGCKIIALCNAQTVKNPFSEGRRILATSIANYGSFEDLGDAFKQSERYTSVNIGLVKLEKPGAGYNTEFEGFFLDEDETEAQANGIMPYNVVRDLVNRYVEAIKIFDEQIETATRMNKLTGSFYSSKLAMSITENDAPKTRQEFKKDLQKAGWMFIFNKMNMGKYMTKSLKETLNVFVEKQTKIPFSMRNIYHMLDMVVQTHGERIDKAIEEVFDRVTAHHHDNRHNLEGWKTNSHYLLTKRFIIPSCVRVGYQGEPRSGYGSQYFELVEDMVKAICFITGDNYDTKLSLQDFLDYKYFVVKGEEYINDDTYSVVKAKDNDKQRLVRIQEKHPESEIVERTIMWGKWVDWGYFRFRCYKKGTCHLEFKSDDLWSKFNQRVAKIKGYPLYEKKASQTEYQKKQTGYKAPQPAYKPAAQKPKVLATFKIAS